MAINKDGSSSKPGDWAGSGASGGGVYSQPGQRSSYDSKGNKLTDYSGNAYKGPNTGGGKGSVDPIASLFRGGKGGPTGSIGAVNPALRTRRPVVDQPVEEVSLPPPAAIEELQRQALTRPLTPEEQAMINSWKRYSGNAFRWPTVEMRDRKEVGPGIQYKTNWNGSPGYHTGTGPAQTPGAIYPNPGGGYNPGALERAAANQEQLKNSFSTPKYQQRVDHVAGGSAKTGWGGAR